MIRIFFLSIHTYIYRVNRYDEIFVFVVFAYDLTYTNANRKMFHVKIYENLLSKFVE